MFPAVSILAFVVLGSVLEGVPAIVLFGPLLFPIARQLGIHEVHYSVVVILHGARTFRAVSRGRLLRRLRYRPCQPGRAAAPGHRLIALLIGIAISAAIPRLSIGFL